jgi:hypothetical protein
MHAGLECWTGHHPILVWVLAGPCDLWTRRLFVDVSRGLSDVHRELDHHSHPIQKIPG